LRRRSVFVTRFFQLVSERQFLGAERILERIKNDLADSNWNKGYLKALEGLLLVRKTKDEYAFLTNDDSDSKEAAKLRKEFLEEASNKLHTDFDRGYFSAVAEYFGTLKKMRESKKEEPVNSKEQKPAE